MHLKVQVLQAMHYIMRALANALGALRLSSPWPSEQLQAFPQCLAASPSWLVNSIWVCPHGCGLMLHDSMDRSKGYDSCSIAQSGYAWHVP